ncbi:MAG: bifunctional lysine ketoglutarate reductase /saccharopine dehydrogenase family protein [Thermoplasmatales archaeon]|nr:bifunctional lysine ketoglutarate reductase /saccharopine dehydrogenase family protein [Thermoplasmatales archaeon]
MNRIGIRREDKNIWERRTPVVPEQVKEFRDIEFFVQPSKIRVFKDREYTEAGAIIHDRLNQCEVIFAVKEIPLDFFDKNKTYVFFSHTIKGQKHNMPMLKKMMELKCQLIDYEKIVDEKNSRLIFFGRYAGLAGMIDTLWALGQRLNGEGIENPFAEIKQTYRYSGLEEAKNAVKKAGGNIKRKGLPESLTPMIFGIAGYGNVSKGAQEIISLLPVKEITPEQVVSMQNKDYSRNHVYKVVFKEEDIVEPLSGEFELQDYYKHPEKYKSKFDKYIPHLTVLVNAIYWDKIYPRLVTKKYLKELYAGKTKNCLRVIGDIGCDINGAVECTGKTTTPDKPVFVYNPLTDKTIDGFKGEGIVVLAVDNLPCELPKESSEDFSSALKKFIPLIASADFSVDFEDCNLPPEIKNAVIVYHGKLTPNYQYLEKYLEEG